MKTYKDNSGVEIRAGQTIRYQRDLVLRVIVRGQVLCCIPLKNGQKSSIPLDMLCDGKDVCKYVDVISKRPL